MRAVLVVVLGGAALAAPPALLWEGKLVWTPPVAPAWSSTLSLTWPAMGWEWTAKAVFEEATWTELTFSAASGLGQVEASPSLSFDPQRPGFRSLTVPFKAKLWGLEAEGIARLEEEGFGWGLTFHGPKDSFLEGVRLRFNLKRFSDEVFEETFAPSFSFGEVRFRMALPCCVERVRGWLRFTKAGFSELGVSFPLPLPRETGLFASGAVRFSLDKKNVFLGPGFTYELPPCVEAFMGLDWDQATWTLRGIKLYAVGLQCEVGTVRVRALTQLEDIGLIKRPYWEALWLEWEGGGCCGPSRFSAAAYFGVEGLFGLGELDVGVELALAPGFTLGLGAELPAPGEPSFSGCWRLSF